MKWLEPAAKIILRRVAGGQTIKWNIQSRKYSFLSAG
jgi:hypothetical protein